MTVKKLLFALVATALLGAACSGSDSDSAGDAGGASRGVDASAPEVTTMEESGGDLVVDDAGNEGGGGSAVVVGQALTAPSTGPNVIKTADISLEVPKDDFRAAVQDAVAVAEARGGFVLTSETSGTKKLSGTIVLRVPAAAFEAALGQLKGLGEVTAESVTGQDVTEEFVDLQARLRNLEAQETVLLRLMDRSASIADTIKVQRELSGIQLEIERLRGRLRYLTDQTTFSTIHVNLFQAGVAPTEPAGALTKAWRNAKDTAVAVVSAVIVGAGFVIPLGVLLFLVALAVRFARPRLGV